MSVRLWPTLPKEHEDNGLTALERPLLDDPVGPYYFVAEVNRRRATIDDDDDATTPTIRVLRGEALFGEQATAARDLLRLAQEKRCGKRPGPAPTMFDRNGHPHEDGHPEAGDGDGETPGDEVPGDGGDGDPADGDGGQPVSPRFLSAVPDGSPDGE